MKHSLEKMKNANSPELKIEVVINTPMEAVFNFKCINAYDQNLEIRIENHTNEVITILNQCDFISRDDSVFKVDYLYPPAPQTITPGDMASFYCWMDETKFSNFTDIILYEEKGTKYRKKLR